MKALILLITMMIGFTVTDTKAQNNPQQLIQQFFTLYKTNPSSALDYLFGTNRYLNQNQDALVTIKNQLNGLLDVVGPYQDIESFDRQDLGANYTRYRYLVRYERQPLLFTFILYRAGGNWTFQNFIYDSELEFLFEEPTVKQL